MSQTALHTYLNDHLAGSVLAVDLLDRLAEAAVAPEAREFLSQLRKDIVDDQETLQALMRRVGGTESPVRQAGAWVAEKLARAKLRVDDVAAGKLRPLEELETLALGIQGKLGLWMALETIADRVGAIREIDLPRLQRRARDQYARVEARRLAAARECLGEHLS